MTINALFKYGALTEHSEALFTTPSVWFSSAAMLNDPFELRPWFSFEGEQEQIVELLTTSIRKRSPGIPLMDALAQALEVFGLGRHRDPATWEALRQDLLSSLERDIGLYCLSTSSENILMWSHYARNHEGYCLEFAATDETPFFGEAQQVRYETRFPVVDYFNTPHELQVDLIFLTKFKGWEYESEYRIVDHIGGPGLHQYPEELLLSVTFGLRMSEKDKMQIRHWISQRGVRIALYQAVIDQTDFKMTRVLAE